VELNRVDWEATARALTEELRRANAPAGSRARRKLAALSSLRARFTDDLAVAAAATATAMRLEPLEPLHQLRDALARLRFGDLAGALERIERMPGPLADLPRVLIVKALATLRRGEARTARNIAGRAVEVDPRLPGARFLHAEATLLAQARGGLDKLAELPRGPELEPAWADLLAKLAILRPGDHRAIAMQLERGVIGKGSRAEAIVRSALRWASPAITAEELAQIAEQQVAGSRSEQLTLALLATKLADGEPAVACTTVRELAQRHGDRPSIRRAFAAALTRLAISHARKAQLAAALRLVQACAELEPHEPLHQQNCAALFTLLGEHEAALDAWAALDQLHFRLALLGRIDAACLRQYAAPHRMFSLAARLAPGTARTGVFVLEADGDGRRELTVNQEVLDRDPEQLRHWLHHSRAALVFEVLALGGGRDRLLLAPMTPADAAARAEGLCVLARSLGVLVRDEGQRLADGLAAQLRAAGRGAPLRYAPAGLDPDAQIVQRHALELYAEVGLLCWWWEPDPGHASILDEVIETLRALAPFFDDRALDRLLKEAADGPPTALAFLRHIAYAILELGPADRGRELDARQRRRVTGALASRARVNLVRRRCQEAAPSRNEAEHLVEQLELARKDDPASPVLEYTAAQVLAAGELHDEALEAIRACHRIVQADHPLLPRVEELRAAIEKARAGGTSAHRDPGPTAVRAPVEDRGCAAREAELEAQPASIGLYIELCRELGLGGRWSDAHAWAARAVARCLAPASQLRARELALELLGLEALAAKDRGAAASYLAGARTAALRALEAMPVESAGVEYVRGVCLLAADRRAEARASFASAIDVCTRGLFLAVLRPLAADIERPLLEAARQEIDAACAERRYADAYARIAERVATVSAPERYLIELARVQVAALLTSVGTASAPAAPPPIPAAAAWRAELDRALAIPEPAARARACAELAAAVHEPSAAEARALLRKLDELARQLAAAAALERSNARAAAGDLGGALAALGELGSAGELNARVTRQRAILLLRLDRYEDAARAVEELGALADPVAREFVHRYPGLCLRQRIASASALIRSRDFARARAVLEAARAPDPDAEVELAYCRACCAAAEGYRRDEAGERRDALLLLLEALRWIESCLEHARRIAHARALELHRKLEADVAALEGVPL
jgi:hypothetical protein